MKRELIKIIVHTYDQALELLKDGFRIERKGNDFAGIWWECYK